MRRAVGLNPPLIDAGVFPQLAGDLDWIDAGRLPPSSLVAGAMDRAMMDTAERHGEFIAGLAAERARLQVAQVMRVGWLAAADEAWLLGDRAKVLPVAITPWCGNGEDALVDAVGLVSVSACGRDRLLRHLHRQFRKHHRSRRFVPADGSSDSLLFKGVLYELGIRRRELFLAASASRAQLAASSAEAMLPISASSLSRRAADCSASMIDGASPFVTPRPRPLPGVRDGTPRLIGQSA